MNFPRIYLSPPHMSGHEQAFVANAFNTNWIAPLGPNVDAFEREFCDSLGAQNALATSSGTAALHLALILAGVGSGDEVLVSTFTFSASVNPILYCGAYPTFIDSELISWNMDPGLLAEALAKRAQARRLPKAIMVVHLYGQSADLEPLVGLANEYGITVIEDAAESLGATYKGRHTGTFGKFGVSSFNGNKIITTSGGGMLMTNELDQDGALIAHARKLATQSRDAAPHYQHSEIGYNYRMSNVLAGIGRGQLRVLADRVAARRRNFEFYQETLGSAPGIAFMPEPEWGRSNRWLTCVVIDPSAFGATREEIRIALESHNIESRPLWKPMHLQPIFSKYEVFGGKVSEGLFENGLCLPSGSSMTESDLQRVAEIVLAARR